jgi:hypothetical protein
MWGGGGYSNISLPAAASWRFTFIMRGRPMRKFLLLLSLIGVLSLPLILRDPGSAIAVNCSANPFLLIEGTIASATQVMANFNNLLNCANTVLGKFTGPGSSVSGNAVTFNGTDGQHGQDSGVALDNLAWGTYDPHTPTCTVGGAFTSATATGRYKAIGKIVHFIIVLTVTTNGPCGGVVNLGVPVQIGSAVGSAAMAIGVAPNNFANNLICLGSGGFPTIGCTKYDGSFPFTDASNYIITGSYEGN